MLTADVHILHKAGFYRIVKYACHCTICSISGAEYNDCFYISFIRKGFFEYRTFRRNEESHVGRILISKPGYEHTTRHIDDQPDITTTLEFTRAFYKEICEQYRPALNWLLGNNDLHSVLINSNAELEYLHDHLLRLLNSGKQNSLQVDELAINILQKVITVSGAADTVKPISDNLKKYHLTTVESAKDFLLQNFQKDISLQQLAEHCHTSLFHFSRIFKTIMNVSPHQFLGGIRLNHAKLLLGTTSLPVTDIAFGCGFNSLEHFVTAYKKQFSLTPSSYRARPA